MTKISKKRIRALQSLQKMKRDHAAISCEDNRARIARLNEQIAHLKELDATNDLSDARVLALHEKWKAQRIRDLNIALARLRAERELHMERYKREFGRSVSLDHLLANS